MDVSRNCMESDLAWARTHTLTSSPTGVVDRQQPISILAAGSGLGVQRLELKCITKVGEATPAHPVAAIRGRPSL